MPVPWVQSINPVFIIVLSGVFAAIWTKLGHRQPATPLKFAAGTMTMGLAFLLSLLFLPFVERPNSTPLLALIGIVLVFTLAELLLPRSGSR
jgi:proton-dependent oligopeptide transporter, POT family